MSTSPDRATIIKGPAQMVWDGNTIKFAADFVVQMVTEYFDVSSNSFGRVDRRIKNRYLTISGTPLEWAGLASLFPFASFNIGDAIFGGTDKPAVITPKNGAPLTIANAMITKLPGITLHPSKSILRDAQWTGLVANSSDPSLAASYFSFGTPATGVALTAPSLSSIPNAFYSSLFNAVTYQAEDGFDIDFNLGLEPDLFNGLTVNMRVTELEAAVKFTPQSLTEANYATLLGWNTFQPGDSQFSGNLVVSGDKTGKPTVTLAKMQVQPGGVNYGRKNRLGDITLASIRQQSAGSLAALWTFGTVP